MVARELDLNNVHCTMNESCQHVSGTERREFVTVQNAVKKLLRLIKLSDVNCVKVK